MNKEELHQLLHPMKVIGLGGNPALNEKIAAILHQPLIETAVHHFSDGEIQVNIGESVRGCDVFVIQSIQDPVNENFMELEIVLDALQRASAHVINVVVPYLAYSRSDTKTRSREPITAKLVANLLQLTGMDRLITVDLHASQIQGFYNIPVDHLHAIPLLGQYFLDNGIATKEDDDIVVAVTDSTLIANADSESEIEAYIKHRDTKGTFYPLSDTTNSNASVGIKKVDPSVDTYSDTNTYYIKNEEGGYSECTDVASYTTKDENGNTIFDTNAFTDTELYTEIPEDDTTTTPEAVIVDVAAIDEKLKTSEGSYYQNMFEMIRECGGCEVIDESYKNDSDWLTSMVEQGEVGIYVLSESTDETDGYKFEQTSTSDSSYLSDTSISSIDSTELKRAEAEYNKDLKAINRKDTQYDTALEELETERTAITTELDSLRTVIDDNVERTFGIFS